MLDNLRGDQPPRLGVTYDQLKTANEKIVCAHLSAYGRTGARTNWPGYDYLMQAEAGYLSLTGEPEQAPARFGLSIVDMMAGLYAGLGLTYAVVSLFVGGILVWEHRLIKPGDLSRVNVAFFTLNGVISVFVFLGIWADLYLGSPWMFQR